ncbi:MAG: C-GCAxxG-C-C family (seleno)protein [Thermoanaerobaculaceae bacterium]
MAKARRGVSAIGSVGAFLNRRACSDAIFAVLDRAFDPEADPGKRSPEERACQVFAGGILQHGYQCGMLWGAALAAGAQACRLWGPGPRAEAAAILAARRVVDAFRVRNRHVDCSDITEPGLNSPKRVFRYFVLKGGAVGCFGMAGRTGPLAFREVEAALADAPADTPTAPVSCAAEAARRMGASERHAIMVAGLAGGVGLCGGGCGALGAALWVLALRELERGVEGSVWESTAFRATAEAVIKRFLVSTDYRFECAEVVGRTFGEVGDHASFLRGGGCARVIEALSAR